MKQVATVVNYGRSIGPVIKKIILDYLIENQPRSRFPSVLCNFCQRRSTESKFAALVDETSRAIVGGPAGQAMAGPVLGLTKQYSYSRA